MSPSDETLDLEATLPDTRDTADTREDLLDVTSEPEGRYRIERLVARGGQSAVYLAWDTHLGRHIAFKQPTAGPGSDSHAEVPERNVRRFLEEARVAARLEHPNIVPIYEIGRRADGSYYAAQKLIRSADEDGEPRTLASALADARGLGERLALLPHVIDICQAVAYAHDHGVLHRDIKPDNVVLGAFGETVLLDWGLAQELGRREQPLVPGSQTIVGTPPYMSPEQAAGRNAELDERSDVWSLGAVLFELLTGRPPFTGDTAQQILFRIQQQDAPDVRSLDEDAPPALAAVAQKALRKRPSERYASALEMADDLVAFQSGGRVGVYDYSLWELLRLFVSRHRAVSAVTAVALVLLVGASLLILQSYQEAERYLAEARQNLATALVEKARDAEQGYRWDQAALYYAGARVQDDTLEARWGARLAGARPDLAVRSIGRHERRIQALAFFPDGNRIVTGAADHTAIVWDVESARLLLQLEGHGDALTAVAVSPDGNRIATGAEDFTARLWDARTGQPLAVLIRGNKTFHSLAFSPGGETLAAGTGDHRVVFYDAETGQEQRSLAGHSGPVYSVTYTPDGRHLASASWDQTIAVWNAETGELVQRLTGHSDAVLVARFSPDGRQLTSGGRDHTVRLWNWQSGELDRLIAGHDAKVYALGFSPGGELLATGGTDQTVRMWRAEGGEPLVGQSYGQEDDVRALAFSPDGRWLAWGGARDLWIRPIPRRGIDRWMEAAVYDIEYSGDGATLVHPVERGILVRDGRTFQVHHHLDVGRPKSVSLSSDGELVAFDCDNTTICLFDVPEGSPRSRIEVDGRRVESVALSPDGTLVASGSHDGNVRLFAVADGERLAVLEGHTDTVFGLRFSPDGRTLASGSYDKTLRLWDVEGRTERARGIGHSHGIRALAFSPDGDRIATASYDETIRLWSTADASPLEVLVGHDDHAYTVAFLPDGETVVSGAWDGTLRVWGLPGGRPLATFIGDEARVYSLAVAPDGDGLVYAGNAVHPLRFPTLGDPTVDLARTMRETGMRLQGVRITRE